MEDKTISLVNGRFDVGYMEAGEGPDLLFIHGAGGLIWDPFLEQLSQHHRVLAPKLPGTANSTGVEWLMDHHDVFYFYWDFLDALGVDDVIVVGHSMGGWFAAEVAAMQPSRVSKLVLIAPAGLWNDDYPVADFFAMMPNELIPALFHDTEHPGAKMMTAPPPEDPDELRTVTVERAKMLQTAARFMWPIPDKRLSERIHRVTSPTLIVWGASDGLIPPQYAEDFNRAIPNSEVAMFSASGHMPQVEEPEAVLAKLGEFLTA